VLLLAFGLAVFTGPTDDEAGVSQLDVLIVNAIVAVLLLGTVVLVARFTSARTGLLCAVPVALFLGLAALNYTAGPIVFGVPAIIGSALLWPNPVQVHVGRHA
jgi:hypothetical protein